MTALVWRSPCNHNACLQVAAIGGAILIRDSKDPSGGTLGFSRSEFAAFVAAAARGDYDDLR